MSHSASPTSPSSTAPFRRSLAGLATIVLLALGTWAQAQPSPEGPSPGQEATPSGDAESPPPAPDPDAAKLEEAKRYFREGNELRKVGDFERALVFYMRSREALPSVPNTMNAALCLDKLGRYDEALELYEELLTTFRDELTQDDRDLVSPEMARLRGHVGSVDVQANVGGTLVIDGRKRGDLPLMAPVRVLPGTRTVRVIKDGYRAFEETVEVKERETLRVDARLEPLAAAGMVRIDDAALAGAEVAVDGAPVGVVPWSGTLEPGTHYFTLHKEELGSAPKGFVVVKGQTALLAGELAPLGPELRITVVPPSAKLWIGDVELGAGRWQGRLPIGEHLLEAREEGYFDESRTLNVTADMAGAVEVRLRVDEEHARWGVAESGAFWIDVFGGFGVVPSYGSETEDSCGTYACGANPPALGFLVGGRAGYELSFGLSIEVAGGYLLTGKTLTRAVDDQYSANPTVPIRYDVEDQLRVSGPFAGAGLGYRWPFADPLELRGHLLVGALFAFTRDTVTATARTTGEPAEVTMAGSGSAASAADLFILPSVELAMRFGGFSVGVSMAAAVFALQGPARDNGDLAVSGSCPQGTPTETVACAPRNDLLAGETGYGAHVMILPGLTAGYLF